jgi:hypothetical protein
MGESIVFVPETDVSSKWIPVVGEFTEKYLETLKLDQSAKQRILNESSQILSNCNSPLNEKYAEAGLVVGYVQSGKTLSFTSITALARDNGYGIVIVLAGVTNLLKDQSVGRLVDDLMLESFTTEWRNFTNPGAKQINQSSAEFTDIESRLASWKKFVYEDGKRKPTLMFTVLKHTGRLNNLANLLEMLNLDDVPTLIIDDESDQASPNNKSARNLKLGTSDTSSVYAAIDNVRSKLSRHTYLQYTATPQANLLAAKTDALSPAFGRVLTAGPDYVGGYDFFGPDDSKLILLEDDDVIDPKHLPEEPPASLAKALRNYWTACAIALAEKHLNEGKPATRSMMIQVSQLVMPQAVFREWTQDLRKFWMKTLDSPASASHQELLSEFQLEFVELTSTYETELKFSDVLEHLYDALEETRIVEVNSTDEAVKKVIWWESQFWILVGGMKLDRGFTVRGITTTYMPRTVSDSAATLQQRARFFGYHRKYFGLCRLFISRPTVEAFRNYLEHEIEIRSSLKENEGQPLTEWKRKFVLGRALKTPVQRSVIGIKLKNAILKEGWIAPEFLHENDDSITTNLGLVGEFAKKLSETYSKNQLGLPVVWKDLRNAPKHVLFSSIPVEEIFDLLESFSITNSKDVSKIMPALTSLARQVESPEKRTVDVVLINQLKTDHLDGRKLAEDQALDNIFIGRNPVGAKTLEELSYVGDREIRTANTTLHLRLIKVKGEDSDGSSDFIVPWFALYMEKALATSYLEEIE